ncbi:MAG: LuxR family transcriptional regulator, partial [Mycobacterium sp.]
MSVSLASDPTRTGRSKIEWWSREHELVQRLHAAADRTRTVLARDLNLPSVEWDVTWRSAEMISTMTHGCLDELRRLPN